jgi:hypothetical protein
MTVGDAYVAMCSGIAVGLDPMRAVGSMVSFNGRASIYGDLALALIRQRGLIKPPQGYWREWTSGTEGEDGFTYHVKAKRADTGEEMERSFSVAEAKAAGLWGGDVWRVWGKKRMLRYRAIGFLARDLFSDVLMGLHIREEMVGGPDDFEPASGVKPETAMQTAEPASGGSDAAHDPIWQAEPAPADEAPVADLPDLSAAVTVTVEPPGEPETAAPEASEAAASQPEPPAAAPEEPPAAAEPPEAGKTPQSAPEAPSEPNLKPSPQIDEPEKAAPEPPAEPAPAPEKPAKPRAFAKVGDVLPDGRVVEEVDEQGRPLITRKAPKPGTQMAEGLAAAKDAPALFPEPDVPLPGDSKPEPPAEPSGDSDVDAVKAAIAAAKQKLKRGKKGAEQKAEKPAQSFEE